MSVFDKKHIRRTISREQTIRSSVWFAAVRFVAELQLSVIF